MRDGARLAAAIEILTDSEVRHRPAADAVKDWMVSHRFAGSKDRAHIGDLVFGALRWRASSSWRFKSDTPRAWALGALQWGFAQDPAPLFADDPHAPASLSEDEVRALGRSTLADAPDHVRGDYPEWLEASFARAFGDARADEGAALANPAPLDLRANTLRTSRNKVIAALNDNPQMKSHAEETPHAPNGVRLAWRRGGAFRWDGDVSFAKGWYEVQDEGSQLAALLCGAKPGMQIADICAGGGGKTLALAAAMDNKGQLYAYDEDGRRLAPIKARLDRAHARNVQIRTPSRSHDALEDLRGHLDIVLVDAPCTGSGVWRRNPDSKWRLKPAALETRRKEQQEALARAAPLVKPGGKVVYVTCSVLPEENDDAVGAFLAAHAGFSVAPQNAFFPARATQYGLQMSPRLTGCDGFYVATLSRAS